MLGNHPLQKESYMEDTHAFIPVKPSPKVLCMLNGTISYKDPFTPVNQVTDKKTPRVPETYLGLSMYTSFAHGNKTVFSHPNSPKTTKEKFGFLNNFSDIVSTPRTFGLLSEYERGLLSKPGVIEYSKVSNFVRNKRIKSIVDLKKRQARIRMDKWEGSLRGNLRPKTTNYLQKVLEKESYENNIEKSILLVHKGIKNDFQNSIKKNNSIIIDLTGDKKRKIVQRKDHREANTSLMAERLAPEVEQRHFSQPHSPREKSITGVSKNKYVIGRGKKASIKLVKNNHTLGGNTQFPKDTISSIEKYTIKRENNLSKTQKNRYHQRRIDNFSKEYDIDHTFGKVDAGVGPGSSTKRKASASHISSNNYDETCTNLGNDFSNDESSIHVNDHRRTSNINTDYYAKSNLGSPLNPLNKAYITVGSPKYLLPVSNKRSFAKKMKEEDNPNHRNTKSAGRFTIIKNVCKIDFPEDQDYQNRENSFLSRKKKVRDLNKPRFWVSTKKNPTGKNHVFQSSGLYESFKLEKYLAEQTEKEEQFTISNIKPKNRKDMFFNKRKQKVVPPNKEGKKINERERRINDAKRKQNSVSQPDPNVILLQRSVAKDKSTKIVANEEFLNYDLKTFHVKKSKLDSKESIGSQNMDYGSFTEQKMEGSVSSPARTREEAVEDYRLEQRFLDDTQPIKIEDDKPEPKPKPKKKLGYIQEETAESVSSEEGRARQRSTLLKNSLASKVRTSATK
ncbi:unnamed protein product [Moneuplotes crassus]|uniref:Uncharacterized protein n=1 Tax=Euplotes crassus TaxID=5936 RepID=A0AAD1Y8I2_EUPCR|nr:unnamed protein product [Moneuplotes crassus]